MADFSAHETAGFLAFYMRTAPPPPPHAVAMQKKDEKYDGEAKVYPSDSPVRQNTCTQVFFRADF
jgi:hypothetical protein